jgi:glyoxylase-like metal-dependent hydrolase (beta-lactamase superfamily II)
MNYSLRAYPLAEQLLPGWACVFGVNDTNLQRIVFYTWIARAEGRTILIDAGPPPDEKEFQVLATACQRVGPECVFRRLNSLHAVLSESGVRPEAIDYLLITQPITYHSGGLVPEYFPKAKVYMSRAGFLEYLLDNPGHPPRNCYFTETTWRFIHQLINEDRLRLVDDPTEVAEGVSFETTGGHHPGSAAVTLTTARGTVGILETAFVECNIEQERPVGVAEDVAVCRRAIRRYKADCDLLLAIHDDTIAQRFPGGVVA